MRGRTIRPLTVCCPSGGANDADAHTAGLPALRRPYSAGRPVLLAVRGAGRRRGHRGTQGSFDPVRRRGRLDGTCPAVGSRTLPRGHFGFLPDRVGGARIPPGPGREVHRRRRDGRLRPTARPRRRRTPGGAGRPHHPGRDGSAGPVTRPTRPPPGPRRGELWRRRCRVRTVRPVPRVRGPGQPGGPAPGRGRAGRDPGRRHDLAAHPEHGGVRPRTDDRGEGIRRGSDGMAGGSGLPP